MKTNIALIGFMGVGKSTVAEALAVRLGKKLVEVDSLITQKTGKSIPDIFHNEGEIAFRELEIDVIKAIASQNNLVIDCGGGVVLNKINIDRLKQNAFIIWLNASPETILKRTAMEKNGRPLLRGKSTISDVRQMMRSRRPYYEAAADIIIDSSDIDIPTLVDQILKRLGENADFDTSK